MNNQFSDRKYNISIIQIYLRLLHAVVIPIFLTDSVVMGHSNNMWLTDRCVLMHITFYEYSVFREFKQVLCITLAKYLGQESTAKCILVKIFIHMSFQALDTSQEMTIGKLVLVLLCVRVSVRRCFLVRLIHFMP